MPRSAILHIGMHKTGSSSIQQAMEGYSDDAFYYAELNAANHSMRVQTMFADEPEQHHSHRRRGRTREELEVLRAGYLSDLTRSIEGNTRSMIISAEDMCNLQEDELIRMRAFLEPHFDRFRVIGYAREPYSFLSSAFSEWVKNGLGEVIISAPRYRDRFEKFFDVFGRDNVEIVRFDRNVFHNGDLLQDFAHRVGLHRPLADPGEQNTSLSREATQILFAINRRGLEGNDAFRAHGLLKKALAGVGHKKLVIGRALVAPVIDGDDLRWLKEECGIDFETLPERRDGDGGADEIVSEADLLKIDEAALRAFEARLVEMGILAARQSRPDQIIDAAIEAALGYRRERPKTQRQRPPNWLLRRLGLARRRRPAGESGG